mgnify:CR=1 FL=1
MNDEIQSYEDHIIMQNKNENLHDKGINHRDVVSHPGLGCSAGVCLKVVSQLCGEGAGGPGLEVAVQVLLEAGLDQGRKVGDHPRRDGNLWQHVHLKVGSEGVWQPHVSRESGEDEIPHLDAVRRNHVAKAVVVITQELGKVVQENQEDPESSAVQSAGSHSVMFANKLMNREK